MKTSLILVSVFLSLLMVLALGCTHNPSSQPGPDITGLWEAVAIAVSALHDQSRYPANDYILTSAQQIIVDGKYVWLITFKPTSFLPKDPSKGPITLGGEIFVKVDLSTKKTEFTYGE
jgi:hypothetical protein